MTEIEKINSSELGKVVGRMLETLGEPLTQKSVWLIQYLRMSADMILTFHWEYPDDATLYHEPKEPIYLTGETLYQIREIPNTPKSYKTMMEEYNEKELIQEFKSGTQELKEYLRKNPDAEEEVWKMNGLIMQETISAVTERIRDMMFRTDETELDERM